MKKQKKLYLICHPFEPLNAPIVRFFEKAGWEVFQDKITQFKRPWTDRFIVHPMNKILHNTRIWKHPSAFKETSLCTQGHATRHLVRSVRTAKPDAVLHLSGMRLWKKELEKISNEIPLVLWMMESLQFFGGIQETAPLYRKIFVYNSDWLLALKAFHIPSELLLHVYDEAVFKPLNPAPAKEYDWCFDGRCTPRRMAALEEIHAVSPNGIIVGSRWDSLPADHPLRPLWKHPFIGGADLNLLYQKSKIIIDVAQRPDEPGGGLTIRLMQALGGGNKVLADAQQEHSTLNAPENSLFTYSHPDEIREKFREALAAPSPTTSFPWTPDKVLEKLERAISKLVVSP